MKSHTKQVLVLVGRFRYLGSIMELVQLEHRILPRLTR